MTKNYVGRREVLRDEQQNLLPPKLFATVRDGDSERPLDPKHCPCGSGGWLDWRDNNKFNGPERLAKLIVKDLTGAESLAMVERLRDHFWAHGGTYWDGFTLSEEQVREICKAEKAA